MSDRVLNTLLLIEFFHGIHVTLCAIWYHLYNLKNVKNTHGGMLLLHYSMEFFFKFFKLYKWYLIAQSVTYFQYYVWHSIYVYLVKSIIFCWWCCYQIWIKYFVIYCWSPNKWIEKELVEWSYWKISEFDVLEENINQVWY